MYAYRHTGESFPLHQTAAWPDRTGCAIPVPKWLIAAYRLAPGDRARCGYAPAAA